MGCKPREAARLVRTPTLFLNELSSFATEVERADLSNAIDQLVSLVLASRRIRRDISLWSDLPLPRVRLTPSRGLEEWGGARRREQYLLLLTIAGQSPSAINDLNSDLEYKHAGVSAKGLGLADAHGGLALSLASHPDWNAPTIAVGKEYLAEDAGLLTVLTHVVNVRHASRAEHLEVHSDALRGAGKQDIKTGTQVWEQRGILFPNLRLLGRVERDLRTMDQRWVEPALERLSDLEAACRYWDTRLHAEPTWRSKVTPESESRRPFCVFVDDDGSARMYSFHARFTPDAGRIHFALNRRAKLIEVAYIGIKLGI